MDEATRELVAIGASAAVNCRPCLRYHLTQAERLGIDGSEVSTAIDVGLFVNRGASERTRRFTAELLVAGPGAQVSDSVTGVAGAESAPDAGPADGNGAPACAEWKAATCC